MKYFGQDEYSMDLMKYYGQDEYFMDLMKYLSKVAERILSNFQDRAKFSQGQKVLSVLFRPYLKSQTRRLVDMTLQCHRKRAYGDTLTLRNQNGTSEFGSGDPCPPNCTRQIR